MSKYFLYTFIIFAHSAVICSDFEPDLHRAICLKNNKYFADLTSDQYERYRPQINVKDQNGHMPIKGAIRSGRVELIRWLLSNGVNSKKSLENALIALYGHPRYGVKTAIVTMLLEHGAEVNDSILKTANFELQDLESEAYVLEMKDIIIMLEAHARWSPARRAWGSAAIRGCLFREARKKTELATVGLLAVREAVKSSTCDAELK